MSKKRILSEKGMEYSANLSDSEWSDISVGESDDFIPDRELVESIFDNTADDPVHNDDDRAVQNNNHDWTDIRNDLPYFGSNQNPGLKIDDIAIEKLAILFFFRRLFWLIRPISMHRKKSTGKDHFERQAVLPLVLI
ncbi:hypothetical protein TNCV_317951 [Trichonephila clavipes]|nr:hypothetical protein TNCV_317951 [Trichonephila clavipes]